MESDRRECFLSTTKYQKYFGHATSSISSNSQEIKQKVIFSYAYETLSSILQNFRSFQRNEERFLATTLFCVNSY